MSQSRTAVRNCQLRTSSCIATLLILLSTGGSGARAQTAETLAQVKKVYVESLGQDDTAVSFREQIIKQLRKSGKLEIVATAKEADAVIKGSESVWVTGYFSTSPRAPSTARQPIVHGFLSAEVVGKDDETLWSYLATPSTFRSGSLTQDLVHQLVTKLAAALEQKSEKLPAPPSRHAPKRST